MDMRINRVQLATELARKDINIKKLSELSGLSRVTVSNVKCGKTCSSSTARKIANALDVDIKALLQKEAN
jgi:putative transcriptional regulator